MTADDLVPRVADEVWRGRLPQIHDGNILCALDGRRGEGFVYWTERFGPSSGRTKWACATTAETSHMLLAWARLEARTAALERRLRCALERGIPAKRRKVIDVSVLAARQALLDGAPVVHPSHNMVGDTCIACILRGRAVDLAEPCLPSLIEVARKADASAEGTARDHYRAIVNAVLAAARGEHPGGS